MGSRAPRQHNPPRQQKQLPPANDASQQTGLRMETVASFIGFAIFPIALVAAGIGYIARQEAAVIGYALAITFAFAVLAIIVARTQVAWRRNLTVTNEFLMGVLVGMIGIAFIIGGLAGLSLVWIAFGVAIVAGGAWFSRKGR